MLGMHET